jgi:hypothetical protein
LVVMGHTKVVFGYSSAPEGCDLDASLGGHAALTLIAMTSLDFHGTEFALHHVP